VQQGFSTVPDTEPNYLCSIWNSRLGSSGRKVTAN
jgi:hypothetical protein